MKKRLVLFDFDGTITTKDTLLEFIRYYRGMPNFFIGFAICSPWLVLMKLRVIPNWKAKEKVLQWFFRGESLHRFDEVSNRFCKEILPSLIRTKALEAIHKHSAEGAVILVVSASAENWVVPWCTELNLPCLATRLEVIDGIITGKIDGANCYGPEKVNRICSSYSIADFDEIIAYGDSSGDREMLALATEPNFKPFR